MWSMGKTQKMFLLTERELLEQMYLHKIAGGRGLLRLEKQHPGNFYNINLVLLSVWHLNWT